MQLGTSGDELESKYRVSIYPSFIPSYNPPIVNSRITIWMTTVNKADYYILTKTIYGKAFQKRGHMGHCRV